VLIIIIIRDMAMGRLVLLEVNFHIITDRVKF